ncbi:unnamed protein product [Sphenostylis stenocarpa]|uniref:Uncharacterized protein n=1 Tax=Sphenostylis stenocarpa TaxID=92480 RepID=A0AA86T5Y0_9FABA|nr:unnamed protein product [Sphenostylis stenocarpa]
MAMHCAVGVIAGLYIVVWSKAKDFVETCKMISSRMDLEEPLLSEKCVEFETEEC